MNERGLPIAAAGALLAALGIALGAFGAHALKAVLDAQQLDWWHNACQYQMWNAVGLVALGALPRRMGGAAVLIVVGTIIFCGSLYVMALTGQRWLGMVTPVGGVAMIAGWTWAALALLRGRSAIR